MRAMLLLAHVCLLTIMTCPGAAQAASSEHLAAFDPREATIDTIHDALFTGQTTCRKIALSFLARIQALNPSINAIIALNADVLHDADILDGSLASNATGSLFCVPILLKDNFDTANQPTTGGCLDLAQNSPLRDAPTVMALKRAGALILGKANMHELALEGLSVSSLGGQTLNPYDLTRTPGGSSGGSAAAVAASLAVLATGTDTVNSLRSPASANSLVSMRPTRGLVTRTGLIPISYTQDAAGVIARNVKDLSRAMEVLANIGYDAADNVTALRPAQYECEYYASVARSSGSGSGLKGKRFGLIEGFLNRTKSTETTPVNDAMDDIIKVLEREGATVISIQDETYDTTTMLSTLDVQRYEYREGMDHYLRQPRQQNNTPSTLGELYNSGKYLVIPAQYEYVTTALVSSTSNQSYDKVQRNIQNLTLALQDTFASNELDAVIYPEQENLVVKVGSPSQSGRNGILAALTGSPVVTVPIGFSPIDPDAPRGVPIGMEILGRPWNEQGLLKIAHEIEQSTHVRRTPLLAEGFIEVGAMDEILNVRPNTSNIPDAYPIGRL